MKRKDLSDEDRLSIEEALKNHGDEARVQRQAMKDAIKQWGGNLKMDSEGLVDLERAVDRLPMFNDEPIPINDEPLPINDEPLPINDEPLPINDEESTELTNIVHLSAEDYSGNFVLPSYGVIRPGADYYASNLKAYVFVIADLSLNKNFMYVYDERGMGKDCDALCSIRLYHHLKQAETLRLR